jgi:hypothetical protein
VRFDGADSLADRIEQRVWIKQIIGMPQEVGETPSRGLNRLRLADPAQLFLDAPAMAVNRSDASSSAKAAT